MTRRKKKGSDMTMSDLIRARRMELDWSQGDLARKLGVGQQTVSRWEAATAVPRPRTIKSIAEVLGLNARELLALAGYLTEEELPNPSGNHEAVRYDRISTKLSQLDERERNMVENLIDTMLRGD